MALALACWGSGLGPGVPAGDGVWRVLEGLFGKFWVCFETHRKPLLWPWPWGACWGSGLGPGGACWGGCLEGLAGGFWRVWKVSRILEGLERLQAGKRQL